MRPSQAGPAQQGVTTHELLRLLGTPFRTDATIDRVEPGRLLQRLGRLGTIVDGGHPIGPCVGQAADEW